MVSLQRAAKPTDLPELPDFSSGKPLRKMPSKVNKILGCFKPKLLGTPERRTSVDLEKKLAIWMKTYNKAIKILLLGAGESGKTTIIKQMKILHFQGFTPAERLEKAREIRTNVLECIVLIVREMSRFEIPLGNKFNSPSFNYIRNLDLDQDFEYTPEFFQHVKNVWEDPGVQASYDRGHTYQLPDCAKYFLDRVSQVGHPDYVPSDEDILHSRRTTTDIQKIEFQMKVPKKYGGGVQNFWMFDVGGQRGERRKWIQVFDGIHMILFLVACNVYDQFTVEDPSVNRLQESINLFKDVWSSRFLQDSGFIIFLNKQDLLQKKVEAAANHGGPSIGEYFPDYYSYTPANSINHHKEPHHQQENNSEYIRTRTFIRDLFWYAKETTTVAPARKMSFTPVLGLTHHHPTQNHHDIKAHFQCRPKRDCYWHYTTATDTNNIQTVFEDVHHMIINHNLETLGLT